MKSLFQTYEPENVHCHVTCLHTVKTKCWLELTVLICCVDAVSDCMPQGCHRYVFLFCIHIPTMNISYKLSHKFQYRYYMETGGPMQNRGYVTIDEGTHHTSIQYFYPILQNITVCDVHNPGRWVHEVKTVQNSPSRWVWTESQINCLDWGVQTRLWITTLSNRTK